MRASRPTVVLGVDQAACSGAAIHAGGRVVASGVTRNARERREAVTLALGLAGDPRGLLVVLEDHGKMPLTRLAQFSAETGEPPSRNADVIVGMGDARGRWREQLELAGVPLNHFLLVEPRTWRQAVFGRGAHALGTDAAKALALQWASQVRGERVADDNEAEAIAIATWGARNGVLVYQGRLHEARMRARARRHPALQAVPLELALAGGAA